MKAKVCVTPRKVILHPESKAVARVLQHHLGFEGIQEFRIGKYIEIELRARSMKKAREQITAMLPHLHNPLLEEIDFTIEK